MPTGAIARNRHILVKSMNALIAGIFFGIIGTGYFMYGRKAHNPIALAAGIGLGLFPYFVDGFWLTMAVGLVLAALPFVISF